MTPEEPVTQATKRDQQMLDSTRQKHGMSAQMPGSGAGGARAERMVVPAGAAAGGAELKRGPADAEAGQVEQAVNPADTVQRRAGEGSRPR